MRDVIPPGYHDRIFEVLIQVPFDYLIVDGEVILITLSFIQSCV